MTGFKFINGWSEVFRRNASVRCFTMLNFYAGPGIWGAVILNFSFEYTTPEFWKPRRALADAIAYTDEVRQKNIENMMFSTGEDSL